MPEKARYVHTNLIARDWRALSQFYQERFGCTRVLPERDFSGETLEAGTGVSDSRLSGVHLRLPGYGDNGPTLEIFHYSRQLPAHETAVNRPGFGHIAFEVPDVAAAREEITIHGGRAIGEVVTLEVSDRASVTWCYVTDPEGNVIELQAWQHRAEDSQDPP